MKANVVIAMDVEPNLVEIDGKDKFTGAVTVSLRYRSGSADAEPIASPRYTFSLEAAKTLSKALAEAAQEASTLKWSGPMH